MVDDLVDAGILAVSMVAVLLGVTMLAGGEIVALAPMFVGVLGFAYLKADFERLRESTRSQDAVDEQEGALETLRSRYASGDIDREEFERRLNDLLETETVEQAEKHHRRERVTERE